MRETQVLKPETRCETYVSEPAPTMLNLKTADSILEHTQAANHKIVAHLPTQECCGHLWKYVGEGEGWVQRKRADDSLFTKW